MQSVSVSNLELYRVWRDSEDLDIEWLLNRLLGPREQTPQMKAGEEFHKALELLPLAHSGPEPVQVISHGHYRFRFVCDCDLELTKVRELPVSQLYGQLLVRGRVDSVLGTTITDYKSTEHFDPDRLMFGYQWRFYLDMMQADRFRWIVFEMRELEEEFEYAISAVHQLEQTRYPDLHSDCMRLAEEYAVFASRHVGSKYLMETEINNLR